MSGAFVERLQRALISDGHQIARRKFGTSTPAALQAFQSRHKLRRSKSLNRAMMDLLLEIRESGTIKINEPSGTPPAPKQDPHRGIVTGKTVGPGWRVRHDVPEGEVLGAPTKLSKQWRQNSNLYQKSPPTL